MTAFPKPQPRAKKKKPLRRSAPLTAKVFEKAVRTMRRLKKEHGYVIPGDGPAFPKPVHVAGSSHARRDRERGRMMFLGETQECDVLASYVEEFSAPRAGAAILVGVCDGRGEVMHLGDREGYRPPDRQTAKGCKKHHTDIDGKVGGCGPWFVALGTDRRRRLEYRLIARADAVWFAQTPEERARWDARAAERKSTRAA